MALLVNRDMVHGGTVNVAPMKAATVAAVSALEPGAFLAVADGPPGTPRLIVSCWRGRGDSAINVMCTKESLHVVGHRLLDMGIPVIFPEHASGGGGGGGGCGGDEGDSDVGAADAGMAQGGEEGS